MATKKKAPAAPDAAQLISSIAATGVTLDALMARDPVSLTKDDLEALVSALRIRRAEWNAKENATKVKKMEKANGN